MPNEIVELDFEDFIACAVSEIEKLRLPLSDLLIRRSRARRVYAERPRHTCMKRMLKAYALLTAYNRCVQRAQAPLIGAYAETYATPQIWFDAVAAAHLPDEHVLFSMQRLTEKEKVRHADAQSLIHLILWLPFAGPDITVSRIVPERASPKEARYAVNSMAAELSGKMELYHSRKEAHTTSSIQRRMR